MLSWSKDCLAVVIPRVWYPELDKLSVVVGSVIQALRK